MAKKKTLSKKEKEKKQVLPENILPQNILPMGERVEADKNIYISQDVYKEIHRFTKNKTSNESGGILVGSTIEEFGKVNIIVSGFIEAKYSEGTPTTLKFTHETWEYVHSQVDETYPEMKILGWIHTHPDFGIFLSEYDTFIQTNFFSDPNQIAYVVDPIQKIEGFYFWINGKIEKCKGFYIFDKTDVVIDIGQEKEEPEAVSHGINIQTILSMVLSAAVVFLLFSNLSLQSELKKLQSQQMAIVDSANQSLGYMQQQISILSSQLASLTAEKEPAVEETVPETQETETQEESAPTAETPTTPTETVAETTVETTESTEQTEETNDAV